MNIKAVIFDLDGLLVDTEIVSFRIYKEILKEFEVNYAEEEYVQNYSGKSEIKNVTTLIQTYNLPWSIERGLEEVLKHETLLLNQGVDLKEGAKELLAYLKEHDYKIALATSSTKDRAIQLLNQHEILPYFDAFVFAEDVERGKPYPDIFLKASEKIMIHPNECIVLEDSEADIQAAYSAHIPMICIPDMKIPSQEYLGKTV